MKIPPIPLWGGLLGVCLFLPLKTSAMIDSNGKGMSDLWQWKYNNGQLFDPGNSAHAPEADPDGDGFTNYDESVFGTNPFSRDLPDGKPVLDAKPVEGETGSYTLEWFGIGGKSYEVQGSEDLEIWKPVAVDVAMVDGPMRARWNPPLIEGKAPPRYFWRLKASDTESAPDFPNSAETQLLSSGVTGTGSSNGASSPLTGSDHDADSMDDGLDADASSGDVNWPRTPEYSYALVKVADDVDAKDLNDNGEVLFEHAMWSGAELTSFHPEEELTGTYRTENPAGDMDYRSYYGATWGAFNDAQQKVGFSLLYASFQADPTPDRPNGWEADLVGDSVVASFPKVMDLMAFAHPGLGPHGSMNYLGITRSGVSIVHHSFEDGSARKSQILRIPSGGGDPQVTDVPSSVKLDSTHIFGRIVSPVGWTLCYLDNYKGFAMWDPQGNPVSLPPEATGARAGDVTELSNNQVVLTSFSGGQARVFISSNEGMKYSKHLSDLGISLMGGDGTGITRDKNLYRNGKLTPFRDACPGYGALLDAGASMGFLRSNAKGMYLIQQGQTATHLAIPIMIVPEVGEVGVTGAMVESTLTPQRKPERHFVSPQKTAEVPKDDIIFTVIGPGSALFEKLFEWDGGQPVAGQPLKRKVPRNQADKTVLRIKQKNGGQVVDTLNAWVTWATIEASDGPRLRPPVTNGAELVLKGHLEYRFRCEPVSMFDLTADVPNLSGPWAVEAPGIHPVSGRALRPGADICYDPSRQVRVITKSSDPQVIPSLPLAIPTYPQNPIEGNDDPDTSGEVRPYSPPGTTAIMNDLDDPYYQISHNLGAEGASIVQTAQFREFARTQIGNRWYRCSDYHLSEVIFRAKKQNGQWVDNGSEFILGNGQFPRP